jgi:hypothetical protein
MNIALSPARVRAGQRMLDLYSVAGAFLVAEEEAADALHVATADEMVAERVGDLLATPEARARYAAYLDGLEVTHGTDEAMRAVIDEGRARLADYEEGLEHPGSAPDGPPAREPNGPVHPAPADEEAAA